MTVKVTKKVEIDYGHTLPNHFSFCNQIHGHRGVIEATVIGDVNDEQGDSSEGMVMDFKFLKKIMMEKVHDVLDHGFAVMKGTTDYTFIRERNDKVLAMEVPPTAENLAKWAYKQIVSELPEGVELSNLRWYETPNGFADYSGD